MGMQHKRDQIFEILTKVALRVVLFMILPKQIRLIFHKVLVMTVAVFCDPERIRSRIEEEENYATCKEIDNLSLITKRFFCKKFRCHISFSAYIRAAITFLFAAFQALNEAEVDNLDVPVGVDHEVV